MYMYWSAQEGYLIILLYFSGELDMRIYAVEMLVEFLDLVFVLLGKGDLISLLRTWKQNNSISNFLFNQIYPTTGEVPKFYRLPKIHKKDTPSRLIMSCTGSITYQASKHLAHILGTHVGHDPKHHAQNREDFVQKIKDLEVTPGQKLVSYDITSLFTRIPVTPAIEIVNKRLGEDTIYDQKSCLTKDQIISLLTLVLNSTYVVYRGI